jgi:hypothetical protein
VELRLKARLNPATAPDRAAYHACIMHGLICLAMSGVGEYNTFGE